MGYGTETIKPSTSLPQTDHRSVEGPKMFSSCLLLVVAFGANVDGYGRRRKPNVDESDVRQSRGSSVEDFDISDRRSPSVEDFGVEVFDVTDFDVANKRTRRPSVEVFEGTDRSMKMEEEDFGTPRRTPSKVSTRRTSLGSSWSSWSFSQKPNFKFPTRNRVKTEEKPRKPKTMPMNEDLPPVKRVVIFPCQDQNLRCKHIPTDVDSPYHCKWEEGTTAANGKIHKIK